jgi:hypothetical protein
MYLYVLYRKRLEIRSDCEAGAAKPEVEVEVEVGDKSQVAAMARDDNYKENEKKEGAARYKLVEVEDDGDGDRDGDGDIEEGRRRGSYTALKPAAAAAKNVAPNDKSNRNVFFKEVGDDEGGSVKMTSIYITHKNEAEDESMNEEYRVNKNRETEEREQEGAEKEEEKQKEVKKGGISGGNDVVNDESKPDDQISSGTKK